MKLKIITQIRAAALIAVPTMALVAAVSAAGAAQAAPSDSYSSGGSTKVVSRDGVRVNYWQGISVTDESGDF